MGEAVFVLLPRAELEFLPPSPQPLAHPQPPQVNVQEQSKAVLRGHLAPRPAWVSHVPSRSAVCSLSDTGTSFFLGRAATACA